MKVHDTDDGQETQVIDTNSKVSVGLVIGLLSFVSIGGAIALVGGGTAYGRMDSKLEALLKGQEAIGQRMNRSEDSIRLMELQIQKLQTEFTEINKNGTEAMKEMTARVLSLNQKVEAYTTHGSPATVARVNAIDQRIDKLERDLTIHIESTKGGR